MNISTPPILNNQEVVDDQRNDTVFFLGGGGEEAAYWGKQLKSGRLVILILVMSQSFKRKIIAASELQCYRAFLGYRGPRIYKMLTRSVRDANVATFIGSGHKKTPLVLKVNYCWASKH